jgi:pyruvate/2-oxoglutarate/acetoin dehydrogenase E1 component
MSERTITYAKALNEALREEMLRDDRVLVMGEDIGRHNGPFRVTEGLLEEFGANRVRDTPISEAAIAGAAAGAAVTGLRPVAEIMFIDFSTLATDQIINQAAKMRYMFGGKARVPVVYRTQGGAGRGNAAQHSQSLESWYVHIPGLWVVQPSTPYDAKGLLKSAIRTDNPIVFVENKRLYFTDGPVPDSEYTVPLGVADTKREGTDVTIFATSYMVRVALEAAERLAEEGISCEIVDPRTLKPLDMETVLASLRKTHRLVIVVEACRTGSYASEVAARVGEEGFDDLDAPIQRVCGEDVPIPYAHNLETESVPQVKDVIEAVRSIV